MNVDGSPVNDHLWEGEFNPKNRVVPDNCVCPRCMTALGILITYDRHDIEGTLEEISDLVAQLDQIALEVISSAVPTFSEYTTTEQFRIARGLADYFLHSPEEDTREVIGLAEDDNEEPSGQTIH